MNNEEKEKIKEFALNLGVEDVGFGAVYRLYKSFVTKGRDHLSQGKEYGRPGLQRVIQL